MARSGSGAKRLASSIATERGVPFEDAYRDILDAGPDGDGDNDAPLDLRMVLAWDGNIAELLDDDHLQEIGAQVVREYEIDKKSHEDWAESAKLALKAASQKPPPKKQTPFPNASNVKYPLLTTSCIQFAARAYPAIVRGDEVIDAKPLGQDADGEKTKRAQRSSEFANDQLIYRCTEWEPGTDALLHALPCVGSAFRKVYWDVNLNRPRFDYVPAIDVVISADAPSVELAPRVTQELTKYPYEIEKLTRGDNPQWLECEYNSDPGDSQKREDFLEQCRYLDLDDDGLSEPYVVTVHKDTSKVVRIDPAFDQEDVNAQEYRDHDGRVKLSIISIQRLLPWIDYTFIPNPEGGPYGIGFGQLLASLSDVIDTTLNELLDAGHLANTNTGFLGVPLKTRSGQMEVRHNTFTMLPGSGDIKNAIYRMEFPGPNATLFSLLEFLIETAKDITSVKDVLTGDAPGSQPATSTLALIEQGLQVFSAIYKRIYRSMTREFEMLYRLNARYLSDEEYNKFLDARPPEQEVNEADPMAAIGHNGGPPMTPQDMGITPPNAMGAQVLPFPSPANAPSPADVTANQAGVQPPQPDAAGAGAMLSGAQAPPQAPQAPPMQPTPVMPPQGPPPGLQSALQAGLGQQMQRPSAAQDFNLGDMDIRPVADPTAVTDMQRLAKANFLASLKGDPTINVVEVNKRMLEAARIPEIEKLVIEKNPLMEAQTQAQLAAQQAEAEAKKWQAAFEQAQASKQANLMQAQTDLYMAQAHESALKAQAALQPETQQPPHPHEVEVAQAQAELHRANTAKTINSMNIETHKAAMDEADRATGHELEHRRLQADEERNTLDRVKMLGEQKLSREDTMLQLRKIVSDADQKKADREQAAKEAEAQRKHDARQAEADRGVKRTEIKIKKELGEKDIEAKKEVAKESAKARAAAAKAKPKPKA